MTHITNQLNKHMTLVDVAIVASLCALLQLFMPQLKLLTENTASYTYLTGHFVHLHWKHWLMNMLALFCLPLLLPKIRRCHFWLVSVFLSVGISILLLWAGQLQAQRITDYVGLSGVLHGLYIFFALLAVTQLVRPHEQYIRIQSVILVIGLLAKTVYEMHFHPTQSAEFIGASVVYAAHMDGVILGVVGFMVCALLYRERQVLSDMSFIRKK